MNSQINSQIPSNKSIQEVNKNLPAAESQKMEKNMVEEYDAIVLGTGLTECIVSEMLHLSKKNVLQIDRNKYYGSESASLTPLEDVFKKFGLPAPDKSYGIGSDWKVDLIPKFLMGDGPLMEILNQTGVTQYLELQSIAGSFVYDGEKIHKVPVTASEALASGWMGFFEKIRFKGFLEFIRDYKEDREKTWQKMQPNKTTMAEVYKHFKLSKETAEFTGHALALYQNDDYLTKPCIETIRLIQLYSKSLNRSVKSPFLYPSHGLGKLSEGFETLGALNGEDQMLDKPIDEIVYENGKVIGVRSEGKLFRSKQVYCDPIHAPDRVKKVSKVIRCICLLDHPIPDTNNAPSAHIILPQKRVKRKSDIYISMISYVNEVAPKGWFIATISTTVETDNPEAEIQPALALLGSIKKKFVTVSDVYCPKDDGRDSQVFVSKSYDATSHFATTCDDVLDVYRRGTGKEFVFSQ